MNEQNYKTTPEGQGINETDDQPKRKKTWVKIIVWIIAIIVFVAISFFSFPYVLSIIWGKDAPLPDDRYLLLSAVNIPKSENGYFDLIKLSIISDGETKEAQIKIEVPRDINDSKYLESYDWDINSIEELLNKNEKALQVFSDAANKTQFQFDITANPKNIRADMPVVSLGSWRQVARINAVKAIYLMQQGEEESAFDEAIKIIKIGHNIETSKNIHLISYLVGIAIERTGLETIQTLINNTSLPPEKLSFYQEQIRKYQPTNNSDPFRVEYLGFKNAMQNPALDETMQNLLKNNFYFKPNQTIELGIKHYRQSIDRFEKPCTDTSSVAMNSPEISPWRIYFTENAVGKLLAGSITHSLGNVRDKKCAISALIHSTDILFGIKKYRIDNNSYIQNLQILSPNYINKLPNDPFSGQPFIIDYNELTIHSVGVNHNDNNGKDDDILSSYNFKVVKSKNTQPNINLDTDNDGLTDEDEIIYGTDPHNRDTDGDGYPDGEEVAGGYNPLNNTNINNIVYKPLEDIGLCKTDLNNFAPVNRDTCNDINATDTNSASYCDQILNISRRNICYLKIAKSTKNLEPCNKINDNVLKNVCNIYLIEADSDDEIEKIIFLNKKDADIGKQIIDIQTMYIQEGELSQNVLQQQLEEIINIASEKKFGIDNNNFDLDEL